MIEHLEFNPVDINILLTASHDGTARLWQVDGILTTDLVNEYPPSFAVFSPDNVHLLTGGGDAKGHLWDVAGREKPSSTQARLSTVRRSALMEVALQPLPLPAGFSSGTLRADARSCSNFQAGCFRFSSVRKEISIATGAEVATIRTSGRQVVFNPDGDLVLAAASDNAAHLLETDGTELKKLVGHEGRITGAAFSPDGQLVATASLDHTARIWSVQDGSTVTILRGHSDGLTEVAFSSDGSHY